MKKLAVFLLLGCFIIGCVNKVEPDKAKSLVEKLLNDVKAENYKDIDSYYTNSFNDIEPKEKKIEKYKKLKDVMGSLQSFSLIDSKENKSEDNVQSITLRYDLNYANAKGEGTFIIINDDGNIRITFQNIVSKN
jgi:ankyrin repeat protein